MTGLESGEDSFIAEVDRLVQLEPKLSPIQAALLQAAHLGIAGDSRTFSRKLGIAHALALRELNALAALESFVGISKRDQRTLRTYYALGERAEILLGPRSAISADISQ